jgi:hypothetical protein
MQKKRVSAKGQRRTKTKNLAQPAPKLGEGEMRKVKGGDWLMSPAGNVKPTGA